MMVPQLNLHMDQAFPEKWIRRGDPVSWPGRLLILPPLDFSLWDHMKSLVTETPVVQTAEDLLARTLSLTALE